jgi:membrane-associated phospholipid phosphatase
VYVWHRRHYPQVRTTLVLFTAAALLVQFIPVAPPRMLPGDGMIDTAARYGQSVYGSVAGFNADQLSAMPSVHVGWSLLAALVIVEVSRSRWRWLALAYPLLTMLAVVVTANHYWLDGIAAALLLALALVVQRTSRALYRRCGGRRRADQPGDLRAPVFTPASTSSARWQAASRPGRTSRSVGTSVAHRSMASGQRG